MARNNNEQAAEAEAPAAEAAASGGDKRSIVLLSGEKRADYIRRRWKEGADRSTITKELNTAELNPTPDKKIPYQIVFQATKGQEGGPAPKTEGSTSESSPANAEAAA
jgi:hypothetical protein